MSIFEGTSKTFNLQEALNDAVATALKSERVIDSMVRFTVSSITGVRGGIASFNDLTVAIKTSGSPKGKRAR